MDAYLSKPIQARDLLAALAQVLPEPAAAPEDVFDAAAALERVEGDTELLAELVRLFLDEFPAQRAAIRQAIDAGDARALVAAAHTLKGSVGVLGARAAAEAAWALERVGREGDLTGVEAAWDTLERATRALEDALAAGAGNRE
jgi:HPt (histidine-containing phosphotransfer) domain-containing protein